MTDKNMCQIYVQLLEEGTGIARPTEAIKLESGFYKILAPADYDPDDEVWEFRPGSIVRCEYNNKNWAEEILIAVEQVG